MTNVIQMCAALVPSAAAAMNHCYAKPGEAPHAAPQFSLNDWLRAAHKAKYDSMTPTAQLLHDRWEGSLMVPPLECVDGFKISVQASESHYCVPRENHWPWVEVECGFPSQDAPELAEWKDGDDPDGDSVFGYVPTCVVESLIESHGGVK